MLFLLKNRVPHACSFRIHTWALQRSCYHFFNNLFVFYEYRDEILIYLLPGPGFESDLAISSLWERGKLSIQKYKKLSITKLLVQHWWSIYDRGSIGISSGTRCFRSRILQLWFNSDPIYVWQWDSFIIINYYVYFGMFLKDPVRSGLYVPGPGSIFMEMMNSAVR